ncbi:P-loop containing nucleoside triphosphate hydrolase protein [Gloeophyllum trabeum ATCC 11539]|uniref:p-loop containing nucleoside triphosphate hydrolase protein n=1 Tax=Gloeophyllum trabeum (strain ATCC 11539 / FP-39264 / Madison 617) TaxID=670483 RepID=S7QEV5_GLOTA|nr:P-loop containing nucleoside triphosphate hydrolase protein [Gloeophyllum trabeum ATCC 11539]EPQ57962.1 P-loop containing nucleoside triphosphate hydrolase protein [Gloeophyllum trabeum ATCC 11539]
MFAIASDDVEEVRRVLESGEAEPNAQVGPQSALAFTLTNDRLKNKIGIVKELLAHGADPAALRNPDSNPPEALTQDQVSLLSPPPSTTLDGMDPATRYFISKADNPDTRRASALIHRSFFRPLAKVRYDIIGQDRALEQLFRVLSMNSQQFSVAPLVVLLCGPSGHGKSLLARKFGSLLEVPTHTVNMTTLRSTHDIWLSHSMNPYEEPSSSTLAEFLIDNEGKRCVVVLDEIDKTEDEKFLLSLLMPWEIGRCSPEAGRRHIDVRNVIWIGTANIGHDLVFAYEAERPDPYSMLSREEYVELMRQFRPVVSDRLGASLVSRMTTVLPFVPFTEDEKMAIAAEALYTLGKDLVQTLPSETVETMLRRAMDDYLPDEGARCLYRSVSTQLLDFSM